MLSSNVPFAFEEAYKETDKLDVICAGDKINNPAELLGSESWKLLIKSNKQYGITVILDDQIPFAELVIDVENKFRDSAKFFEQSKNIQVNDCRMAKDFYLKDKDREVER